MSTSTVQPTNQQSKKIGIRDLLPYKSYLAVLVATTISRFGDSLDSLAFSYMVYQLTGSKTMLGVILAVNFIPSLLFTPFTGVIADNYSKKKMIIISDIGRGVMVTLVALLYYLKLLQPWHLFVTTFLISTFEAFSNPAKKALRPFLLPKELFLTAESITQSASSLAQLVGVASVAFFIATIGISGAIAIDALTFFVSALFICFIKYNEKNKNKKINLKFNDYIREIKGGLKFVFSNKIILTVLFLFALINFSIMPFNVLRVPYLQDILGMGPEGLSYISIAFLIGTFLGGIIIAQIGSKFKKSTLTILGVLILGAVYAMFGFPMLANMSFMNPIIYIFALGIPFGLSIPLLSSPVSALFAEKTPKELLGRVSSVASLITLSAGPLSASISGVVADFIPIPQYFRIMSYLILIAAVFLMLNKNFTKE